jgi:hypothetical protein
MASAFKVNDCPDWRVAAGHGVIGVNERVRVSVDIGVLRRLEPFGELTAKAGDVNRRMLQPMRADQDCVLASTAIERIAHPSIDAEGRKTPALRFGDPRVTALAGALSLTLSGA